MAKCSPRGDLAEVGANPAEARLRWACVELSCPGDCSDVASTRKRDHNVGTDDRFTATLSQLELSQSPRETGPEPKTRDENFLLGVEVSAVLEYGLHARPSE